MLAAGEVLAGASATAVAAAAAADPVPKTGARAADGSLKTPFDYGALGDGVADDTLALQRFVDGGGGRIPPATFRVTSTIVLPSGTFITGHGNRSVIRLGLPPGAAVVPLMVSQRGSSDVEIQEIYLDHDARLLTTPRLGNGDVLYGSCLMLMSSSSRLSRMTVANGWDNCIAVCDVNYPVDGRGTGGLPRYVTISEVTTLNAGCGWHTTGALRGHTGTGINVASAQFVAVSSCIDHGSYSGFGTDTGGLAAFVTFENCISYDCRFDAANPQNGSGNAFVHQASQCKMIGCTAYNAGDRGFWVIAGPRPLVGVVFSGCFSDLAGGNGFEISSSNVIVDGCSSYNSGQRRALNFSNFALIAMFGPIVNTTLSDCLGVSDDDKALFGYREIEVVRNGRRNDITATVSDCTFAVGARRAIEAGQTSRLATADAENLRLRSGTRGRIVCDSPLEIMSCTRAQLAAPGAPGYRDPALYRGCLVVVADAGGRLAKSDGRRWRLVEDGAGLP